MKPRARVIIAAVVAGVAGCAASQRNALRAAPAVVADVPAANSPSKARFSLDDIEPRVSMPPGKGTSTGAAPLQAVHLYAQAQAAILDRDRAAAIDFLQKAVAIDPLSYELHVTLARMYLTPMTAFDDRSIDMLEKAADLDPNHLDLQADLGLQYMAKGDPNAALKHFRMALLTGQYASDGVRAASVEEALAPLLRRQGYDQAALEIYQRLSAHLKSALMARRVSPEMAPLLEHAENEIADLLVRTGRLDEAVKAYAAQIAKNLGDFELRSRQVNLLIAAGHKEQAVEAAEAAVLHFRADADSITLLTDAARAADRHGGAIASLKKLRESHPGDHELLYRLADLLHAAKRDAEAGKLLDEAAARNPGDFEILDRQFGLTMGKGDRAAAVQLLLQAHAKAPDLDAEIAPLWSMLARPSAQGRLRYAALAALDVPKAMEGAKWFWAARLASAGHRDAAAHDALQRSLTASPAFAPAYRDSLDAIWTRDDLDAAARETKTEKLVTLAGKTGGEALAEELRGLALLRQGNADAAATLLSHAMELGGRSPDLLLARAGALRKAGKESEADSLLWKLISDHTRLRDAYTDLYLASIRRGLENQAERVLSTWLEADPDGVAPWRIQAIQYQRSNRNDAAERLLVRLFKEHSDDGEAIGALGSFYVRRHQIDRYIAVLKERHAREPANFAVSMALAETLAGEHHVEEAARVVDAARAAAADDADLLYTISGLYVRIGHKQASEESLQQVLKLEPDHAGASNDLGFVWADDGRNLPQAEELIRAALKAEPGNVSFLDSMGWVLYKRGKFAESRQYLDKAIGKRGEGEKLRSDPVVLDHRGDALYRLGEKESAALDWQHAAERIAALEDGADDEMKNLRTRLLEKTRRLKAGETVPVAPAGDPPATPEPPNRP